MATIDLDRLDIGSDEYLANLLVYPGGRIHLPEGLASEMGLERSQVTLYRIGDCLILKPAPLPPYVRALLEEIDLSGATTRVRSQAVQPSAAISVRQSE